MRSNRRGVLGAIAAILGCMSMLAATSGTRVLEELWPHLPGANWSYDRIEPQWGAVAKSTATTVRFTLGDATVVGGSIAVQPLTVDVAGAVAEAGEAPDH